MSGVLARSSAGSTRAAPVVVSSVRYSIELGLGVAPGEVGVGLREAELGEPLHQLRTREGFGEKDDVRGRVHALQRSTTPRTGTAWCAGCRRGKCEHRASTQNRTTSRSAYQSEGKALAVEVNVDDVLVALGRILGVPDGAVGPPVEPLGVLLDPRMIGRALDGEVERDLEPVVSCGFDAGGRSPPIVPSSGCDGVVPALVGADGIDAAGI